MIHSSTTHHHTPSWFFTGKPAMGVEFVAGIQQIKKIDLMWRLFNAWPNTTPRLEKTKAAASRLDRRRDVHHALPPRWAFKSTAEYYDAVLPLMMARQRFILMIKPSSFLRGVHRALGTYVPNNMIQR